MSRSGPSKSANSDCASCKRAVRVTVTTMQASTSSEQLIDPKIERHYSIQEGDSETIVGMEISPAAFEDLNFAINSSSIRRETGAVETRQEQFEGAKESRLVSKTGELRVLSRNVPNKTKLYLADVFTTMIDLRWKWVFLIFGACYIASWTIFGFVWWFIAYLRGSSVCIVKVKSWTSAFLFSVETQETIGYGTTYITTKCPEAVVILQLQTIVGLLIDAFMLGLTFAKLSRPRERTKTVMFSEYAVIAPRDGKMCLMCRVGDIRKSQLVDASVRMQLFRAWTTKEGKEIPFYQEDLKVCYDWRNPDNDFRNQLFLLLPMTIIHVIDEKSPFYDLTPEMLQDSHFEIVVILDGIVEATGLNTQPKTSYLNSEILWGCDFQNTLSKVQISDEGFYHADFSRFDNLYHVLTPMCSPRQYYSRQSL